MPPHCGRVQAGGRNPALLEINPPPMFGTALHPGSGRPCDARLIDVLPEDGGAFVSIVNNQVEPQAPGSTPHSDLIERNGDLQAVALGRATRNDPRPRRGFFNRTLVGVGITSSPDNTGSVERKDAELKTPERVLGADNGIQTNLYRVAPPVTSDVVWCDVRHHDVVADLYVYEQRFLGVPQSERYW
jgi:hypothetical protein